MVEIWKTWKMPICTNKNMENGILKPGENWKTTPESKSRNITNTITCGPRPTSQLPTPLSLLSTPV